MMFKNIKANPFAYVWKNRAALFQPSAYRFVMSRLFRTFWHRVKSPFKRS
jgi:hypothetical protein